MTFTYVHVCTQFPIKSLRNSTTDFIKCISNTMIVLHLYSYNCTYIYTS